jgi:hypothetical protein
MCESLRNVRGGRQVAAPFRRETRTAASLGDVIDTLRLSGILETVARVSWRR